MQERKFQTDPHFLRIDPKLWMAQKTELESSGLVCSFTVRFNVDQATICVDWLEGGENLEIDIETSWKSGISL